jgi:riboflavin synthase
MFTGIVEECGQVVTVGPRLEILARKVGAGVADGDSVNVNGVCLTVVNRALRETEDAWVLSFDLSPETLRRTSLGSVRPGDRVNLERPVTLIQRLGGHLVQGHVDGVGVVRRVEPAATGCEMTVEAPADVSRYLVDKGSVSVDGVSLTVATRNGSTFTVALVPYTLQATNLDTKNVGDPVNIEVDVMAKYVERLVGEAR